VDGFTLALMTPAALDSYLQARYDRQLVRLDKPVRNSYMWLGANRAYYQQHRAGGNGVELAGRARRPGSRRADAPLRRLACASAQAGAEEIDGALPGQLGGGGIVARRGVVVEAVLDAGVDVVLVMHTGFLQRLS
jgi:hypothetical protein